MDGTLELMAHADKVYNTRRKSCSYQQTVGKQLHTNAFSGVWVPIVHYVGNNRLL